MAMSSGPSRSRSTSGADPLTGPSGSAPCGRSSPRPHRTGAPLRPGTTRQADSSPHGCGCRRWRGESPSRAAISGVRNPPCTRDRISRCWGATAPGDRGAAAAPACSNRLAPPDGLDQGVAAGRRCPHRCRAARAPRGRPAPPPCPRLDAGPRPPPRLSAGGRWAEAGSPSVRLATEGHRQLVPWARGHAARPSIAEPSSRRERHAGQQRQAALEEPERATRPPAPSSWREPG